ncbi:MAG: hypothetical protein RDU14_15500 [Melioribacteraceae bacterium]|nr:hypothetical protein [Melioribacteraceae bacterium]
MPNNILNAANKLNVEIVITKEDDYYVAYCPALELSAYADTIEKAKISFEREMKVFLEETCKRGTLEKYLLKSGWRLQQIPQLSYELPQQSYEKLSSLKKDGGEVVQKEINIPVYY